MVAFPYKILIPQRPRQLVSRPRLIELLNSIAERRLIALTAPAGYGKTSLLVDFAHSMPSLPICWYTLDRFDADPWAFVSYLAAAIRQQFPATLPQTQNLLDQQAPTPFSTVVAQLAQEVYAIGQDLVIVIDDWHLVDHVAEICDLLAHLLTRCPNCRLILASRIYPGLPDLMLLAARRQLGGLDEERLRFTAPEVAAVISAEYESDIPLERAELLTEQAKGWIAGVLLTLQASSSGADALAGGAGSERQVYRFLGEQVFDRQPPELRAFLLDTALLDEVSIGRCDALLGRSDSALLLEQLLRNHVFIIEINPGSWRYHPLFREFLHDQARRVQPQRYHELALRVADGYAEQGEWLLAFDACVAVGDLQAAQQIAHRGGQQLYRGGRLETLERWFELLPLDLLKVPLLDLKARVLLDRGRRHEAELLADMAQQRTTGPAEQLIVLLLQSQLARLAGRYEDAILIVQQALTLDPPLATRMLALRTAGICHERMGRSREAIAVFEEALALARQQSDLYALGQLQNDLGISYEGLGMLELAEDYYSQADAGWALIDNPGQRSMSLNSKGVVQHLAGRYREAHATLNLALDCAQQAAMPRYQATVLASMGDLYADLQRWEQSDAAYAAARRCVGDAFIASYLELASVRLLVQQRRYAVAAQLLERLTTATLSQHQVLAQLLRGHIACGLGQPTQALTISANLVATLLPAHSPLDLARAYLLRAQALLDCTAGDDAALIEMLDAAAHLAEGVGHDAFLIAETLYLPGLLRRAAASGWLPAADWQRRQEELRWIGRQIDADTQLPLVVVRTLGSDGIWLNGQQVEIGWLKSREVLYYLLAHPRGATADQLCEAIWPELSPERGREALRTAVYKLRSSLPRELVALQGRQIYHLDRQVAVIDDDVARFTGLLDSAGDDVELLFAAIDLYAGHYLPWSENAWSQELRTHLEQRLLQALQHAAALSTQRRAYADALLLYRRILALDVLDEAAHTGVMRCQIALGNRAAAIDQYRLLHRTLVAELGLDPGQTSEATQLYHKILAAS